MKILEKQGYHLIFLGIMIIGIKTLVSASILQGSLFGISTRSWFWISIIIPIVHQVYVFVFWRAELYYQLLTKWFGSRGFLVWTIGFITLFLARPLAIICLAISNHGSLSMPVWLGWILGLTLLAPVIYLGYSVAEYFGINRALGADHFQPQVYKDIPFVKAGIFNWTSNAMYTFGFLLFWIPGLILLSEAALISALFSHLYIWIHYYFTEYPDIQFIYNS